MMRSAVLVLLAATVAWAHTPSPDEVVASITAPVTSAATGVERAERNAANPRVLVVRVGPGWFARSRDARAATAADWYATWRHAVPDGVVAVLDARTERPVVRYGRGGVVVEVRPGA